MGKKVKVGKSRRDKAYWAAKEIGYRSRASFKLVQLNRKWEFLQKSSVCIDLCAAPGSWMQVCRENMPMSSLVIGVDLAPIKPIPGCIALQNDITTEKCRSDLKKELKTAKADLVLHDGAPNVGQNWLHDAYQQSLLTLHAFKLATEFLSKGGWFVTKVFRSKDYQSLIWILGQFFKKVHATKPAASRNESAEIFVVCQYYLAPDKIDPKFLDPKHVFSEVEVEDKKTSKEIINPERKKKPAAQGYADGVTSLYKEASAAEFIETDTNHIKILNDASVIKLDAPWIRDHPRTTSEIRACITDLKVLGMKELRLLKKWRDALRKEIDTEKKKEGGSQPDGASAGEKDKESEDEDEKDLKQLERQIEDMKDEERRAARRKKKKELKEKQKQQMRLNLKMIIPGDEGPRASEDGLFQMSSLKSKADLDQLIDSKPEDIAEDSDDEAPDRRDRAKYEKYAKQSGQLDSEGLWYDEGKEQDESDEEDEKDSDDEAEDLGLDKEEDEGLDENEVEPENEESHPLLTTLSSEEAEKEKKAKKAEMWFSKIGDVESDSDLEDAEIQRAVSLAEKKGAKLRVREKKQSSQPATESGYTSGSGSEGEQENKASDGGDSDSDSDSSSSDEEDYQGRQPIRGGRGGPNDLEVVPSTATSSKKRKRGQLNPEELALGEQMIYSKKKKRDMMDAGWNRYMFDDAELPDWFVKEEDMHMRRRPDVDPETLQKYAERNKELNVKTIKKVVEAKARKKRRAAKQLEKARKRTASLLDNQDIGSREKATEINKMYKAAAAAGKRKKEVAYVVAKKHAASGKRASRPSGVKGPYKQVDPRMKKDSSKRRESAGKKRQQKRRLKGKQAKPTKQFNTNR